MTKAKAMRRAMEMPNVITGTQTLKSIMEIKLNGKTHLVPVVVQDTFRSTSIAREMASEVETAARYIGVYLSQQDMDTQEKWERILLDEGSKLAKNIEKHNQRMVRAG